MRYKRRDEPAAPSRRMCYGSTRVCTDEAPHLTLYGPMCNISTLDTIGFEDIGPPMFSDSSSPATGGPPAPRYAPLGRWWTSLTPLNVALLENLAHSQIGGFCWRYSHTSNGRRDRQK